MKCPNCENSIENNAVTCEWCGINVKDFKAETNEDAGFIPQQPQWPEMAEQVVQKKQIQENSVLKNVIWSSLILAYCLVILVYVINGNLNDVSGRTFTTEEIIFREARELIDYIHMFCILLFVLSISVIILSALFIIQKKIKFSFGIVATLLAIYVFIAAIVFIASNSYWGFIEEFSILNYLQSLILTLVTFLIAGITLLVYKFKFAEKKKEI